MDCPQCLARVEAAQGLLGGLHALDEGRPAEPVRPARSPWARRVAFTVAALAAVLVAVVWGSSRERRFERALEAERAAGATTRQEVAALAARLSAAEPPAPRSPPFPPVPRGPFPS